MYYIYIVRYIYIYTPYTILWNWSCVAPNLANELGHHLVSSNWYMMVYQHVLHENRHKMEWILHVPSISTVHCLNCNVCLNPKCSRSLKVNIQYIPHYSPWFSHFPRSVHSKNITTVLSTSVLRSMPSDLAQRSKDGLNKKSLETWQCVKTHGIPCSSHQVIAGIYGCE